MRPTPPSVSARLAELGLALPAVPDLPGDLNPNRAFVTVHNGLGYVSGVGPIGVSGVLGDDFDVEAGYTAARGAALYMLRRIQDVLGDLDRVERWVRVLGFVRSTHEFDRHPAVLNGFSDVIVSIWGDEGRCARAAIGTCALPLGMPVEVEAVIAVR